MSVASLKSSVPAHEEAEVEAKGPQEVPRLFKDSVAEQGRASSRDGRQH